MKNNDWEQELHLYRLDPAPPRMAKFQDYIAPYFTDGDITHFFVFLHHYENKLNKRVMGWVADYEMRGHFPDLKQAAVVGMLKALARYNISRGVDFLVYAKRYILNEVDDYVRTMRTGFTVQSSDAYKTLKKAMAIYNQQRDIGDETIALIAAEIGRPLDETADILAASLGFCMDCLGTEYIATAEDGSLTQRKIKKQAYADIAIDHTLSSPSTVERIYRQALEKMRRALEERGWI